MGKGGSIVGEGRCLWAREVRNSARKEREEIGYKSKTLHRRRWGDWPVLAKSFRKAMRQLWSHWHNLTPQEASRPV